ncbi:hypothetical protein F5144DRAFT_173594 [Chaetomium tenue]|uniref:Uncharacterized protein n=1 Tax=Chaetomium tenue TaxID=1854479 RepID=A0ACB7PD90_9PEZI|nr:hypothetical protein F5144DRAFT_173594 [Chaetomium globosum]
MVQVERRSGRYVAVATLPQPLMYSVVFCGCFTAVLRMFLPRDGLDAGNVASRRSWRLTLLLQQVSQAPFRREQPASLVPGTRHRVELITRILGAYSAPTASQTIPTVFDIRFFDYPFPNRPGGRGGRQGYGQPHGAPWFCPPPALRSRRGAELRTTWKALSDVSTGETSQWERNDESAVSENLVSVIHARCGC